MLAICRHDYDDGFFVLFDLYRCEFFSVNEM